MGEIFSSIFSDNSSETQKTVKKSQINYKQKKTSNNIIKSGSKPNNLTCKDGYIKTGNICTKQLIIQKPLEKKQLCPYGFKLKSQDGKLCVPDLSVDKLVFTQIRKEGDESEIDQWIQTMQQKPGRKCLKKNINNRHIAICSKQCLPGNSTSLKSIKNGNVNELNSYYIDCERYPEIRVNECYDNNIRYKDYCIKSNCPLGYEINMDEIDENSNFINCIKHESYKL